MVGTDAGCGPDEITAPGYAGVGNCVGVGGIGKGGTGAVAGVIEGPIVGPIVELSTLHGHKMKTSIIWERRSHNTVIRTVQDPSLCV